MKEDSAAFRLFRNARLATMRPDLPGVGVIENAAILIHGDRIIHAGPEAELPASAAAAEIQDCEGRWITPGLIDCHTHLVHAGHRAHEFELRLEGASYEEIARAGGGIVSSVAATRAASESELVSESVARLEALLRDGVTTVEVKSGYGLDTASEMKLLGAARRLGRDHPVSVVTTFLGAHAVPPEFKGNQAGYLDLVVDVMLPQIAGAGLADAVDAFCEGIAFSPDEVARLFRAAQALGLPMKLHADQLSNLGGAALAARFGALSADHLEHTDEAGALALAAAGTIAVILPGAYYFIRETRAPPIDLFRRHGVSMAVATDCNPGTSPLSSLLLAMNMAATLFRMTVNECLIGVTRHAAQALGRRDIGVLQAGMSADLAIWDIDRPAELVYRMGASPLHARIWRGQCLLA
ncbi:MAG: imidazolonepropionase [Beijerinckiaceae bacterium]|nr:imidazolonepropionase [Beijerinckiaceae bacterium]